MADRLLVDCLGPDGAAAVERAVAARPALLAAMRPRAALAWAQLALTRGYAGEMPGTPGATLEVLKGEGWAFEGVPTDDGPMSGAGGPRAEALAAYLVAFAGGAVGRPRAIRPMVALGKNLDLIVAARWDELAKSGQKCYTQADMSLEKRSKNVREQTRNLSPRKQRSRILDYIRRQGFQPRPGKKDSIGLGPEGRGISYTSEAGASPEHELGHALQAPVGETFEHHQYRMGVPQTEGFRMRQEEAGAHESGAAAMEPMIRRRAGAGLGSDPQVYSGDDPAAKQRARQHLGAFEEGRVKIGVLHPGVMAQGAGLVPGTSVDARINARAAKGELAKAGLKKPGANAGVEAAGPHAGPTPPAAPTPPTAPAAPRTGAAKMAAPAKPAAPVAPGGVKPKKPPGVSIGKSEAEAACGACGHPQVQDGILVGCPCWTDLLAKAEAVSTPLGWVVRLEDPEDQQAFVEAVRHGR